ncbi:MAG: hypothetical protein KDC92_06835, partial [Bacteroidetes bacterium]|nr:hypothetical protein [Bacteroidota bacterium]
MSACLVFSLYTITNSATAQLLGYGNGQVDLPVGKGTVEYIDKHRGAIQSINTTGPNDVITLDPNNKHGVVNGQVLIIQMTGGNPGVHEGHTVLANNNGTITLLGKLVNTYSTSPGDKVQIIKVAEYKSVTLDGGIITCRAWDGHTGGILSMMVKEDFEVTSKGGMVLASGKGFLPEGVTWGTGGSGSAGSTNVGTGGVGTHGTPLGSMGGGIGPCNLPACIQGSYGVQIAGFDGGQGMNGGASGSAGTQTSGTGITYQGSNLNSRFMLGNPGYYQSGHGGGKGGDGGGPGAGGGASKGPQGANGSNGQVGEDGGTGGEPGKGAAGGGSIYIKAGNFDFSAYTGNKPIFYADGAQGAFGEKGELGSAGGLGGYGGKGYCSGGTFYRSGGTGGFGVAGTGANGGDGGNGGHPGYIWLIQEQAPFNSITSSVVSVRGGK